MKDSTDQPIRAQQEHELLRVAADPNIQFALKQRLRETKEHDAKVSKSYLHHALQSGGDEALRREFEYGVRLLLDASCDARIKVSHWMIQMQLADEDTMGVIEFFLLEAEHLASETEGDKGKDIRRVFGVSE